MTDVNSLLVADGSDIFSEADVDQLEGLEKYPIEGKQGVIIIFEFKYASNGRNIYNKDIRNLQTCFEHLNYEVIYETINTKKDIVGYLKKFSQTDFSNNHSVIVAVLSNYGIEANLKSPDGDKIKTAEFLNPFSAQNCPTLRGKPKIFIFQAYNYVYDFVVEKAYPTERDYMFFYSIIEGDISRRTKTMVDGSWFINRFIFNVKSFASKEDIYSIINRTFNHVNKDSIKFKVKFLHKKVPCLVSTLTKQFYLCEQSQDNDWEENAVQTNEDLENGEELNEVDIDNNNLEMQDVISEQVDTVDMHVGDQIVQSSEIGIYDNENSNEEEEVTKLDANGISTNEEIFNVIENDEELVSRCSLTKLLLPTFIMFFTIGVIIYLFLYEEEMVQDFINMF